MERIDRALAARMVIIGTAALLVTDLFFDWRELSVRVAGVVGYAGASSGWGDGGSVAGAAAIAIIVWELVAHRSGRFSPLTIAGTSGLLSLVVLAGIAQEFFAGDVRVETAATVFVRTGDRLWAAWAGLALAVALVGAAAVRLLAVARAETGAHGRATSVGTV